MDELLFTSPAAALGVWPAAQLRPGQEPRHSAPWLGAPCLVGSLAQGRGCRGPRDLVVSKGQRDSWWGEATCMVGAQEGLPGGGDPRASQVSKAPTGLSGK